MGHGRKFRAKLRPTAPLICPRSLRIQTPSLRFSEVGCKQNRERIENYEIRYVTFGRREVAPQTNEGSFRDGQRNDAARRNFFDELTEMWDNEILFFGPFQVGRALTEI